MVFTRAEVYESVNMPFGLETETRGQNSCARSGATNCHRGCEIRTGQMPLRHRGVDDLHGFAQQYRHLGSTGVCVTVGCTDKSSFTLAARGLLRQGRWKGPYSVGCFTSVRRTRRNGKTCGMSARSRLRDGTADTGQVTELRCNTSSNGESSSCGRAGKPAQHVLTLARRRAWIRSCLQAVCPECTDLARVSSLKSSSSSSYL